MNGLTLTAASLLLAIVPSIASAAGRPAVDLQCVAFGMGPLLDCTVRLQGADGRPLTGAAVTLGATMPSMPMAHQVKPAAAAPTGTPGEYRGRLELEMSGAWAVQVDIAGPVRDRVARTLQIDECEGDRRCPVLPVVRIAPPTLSRTGAQPVHKH